MRKVIKRLEIFPNGEDLDRAAKCVAFSLFQQQS